MPEGERWRWLRKRSPFLWLSVTPVVTLPLSALLLFTLGGEHEAEALGLPSGELCRFDGLIAQSCFYYFDFWRTALLLAAPGAINLLAGLWLLERNGYIRMAAATAVLVGMARSLIVPMVTLVIAQFDLINAADAGGLLLRVEDTATGGVGDVSPPSAEGAIRQLLTAVWIGGGVMWVATAALWWRFDTLMARFWPDLDPPGGPRPNAPPRWTGFLKR